MMDIKLEGMDELLSYLNDMGQIGNDVRDKAVDKGGEYYRDKVKENVYRYGLKKDTGEAEESIVKSDVKNGSVDVGIDNQGDGFYLYFWEFGFYHVGTAKRRKGRSIGKPMAARPVMGPVFEMEQTNIVNVMSDEVRRGLGI